MGSSSSKPQAGAPGADSGDTSLPTDPAYDSADAQSVPDLTSIPPPPPVASAVPSESLMRADMQDPPADRKKHRRASSSGVLSAPRIFGRRPSSAARSADDSFPLGPDEAGWDGARASMTVREVSGREELRSRRDEEQFLDFNQTGQSTSEMRVLSRYASVPERERPPGFQALQDEEVARRESRAAKKVEKRDSKAARKAEREVRKGKRPPPAPPAARGTVEFALNDLKRFGVLNLAKMHLHAVPDTVFEALDGKSRVINISNNNLASIDVRFTELVLVQRLIAHDNHITTVPPAISGMSALRMLDLTNNKLATIPDSFSNMPHLEQVNLSNNGLSTLPDSFATLNITSLRLTGNNFITPPRVIEAMRSLYELHLDSNSLSGVPASWSSLSQIDTLNLCSNNISDFPDDILAKCVFLCNLNMRGNPLTSFKLQSLPSWADFQSRRLRAHKHRLESGTMTEADLMITDS